MSDEWDFNKYERVDGGKGVPYGPDPIDGSKSSATPFMDMVRRGEVEGVPAKPEPPAPKNQPSVFDEQPDPVPPINAMIQQQRFDERFTHDAGDGGWPEPKPGTPEAIQGPPVDVGGSGGAEGSTDAMERLAAAVEELNEKLGQNNTGEQLETLNRNLGELLMRMDASGGSNGGAMTE